MGEELCPVCNIVRLGRIAPFFFATCPYANGFSSSVTCQSSHAFGRRPGTRISGMENGALRWIWLARVLMSIGSWFGASVQARRVLIVVVVVVV